jgi:microcin C transport system substrate-binding protein
MALRRLSLILILGLAQLIAASCGASKAPEKSGSTTPTESNNKASRNKDDYPVFPDADKGADPAVPAEQGGKGFTGQGWETNTSYDLIGDPRAVKGGMIRDVESDFPSTLRPYGPNTSAFNSEVVSALLYESLLYLHPNTLDYVPALATHWQISADKSTYRFRIDPNARWADGMPVVADDVVASWSFAIDKGLQDPGALVTYSKFQKPVAESKYIVSVKTKDPNWRNFLYFSGMLLFPAHVLKNIDGARFVKEFNYKTIPGSGPYAIAEADVDKGNSIKFKRRADYWGEKQRRNIGTGNFDEIRVGVVLDRSTEFEKFKKGDTDFYFVNRAQMWAEWLDFDNVKRGLIQKRRIWNQNPNGIQGMMMNTRRAPYDDVRVRQALQLLFDRQTLIEKLMFNAYIPQDSVFPGSIYENPSNEKIKYDPDSALKLLAEAGWKDHDSQGRLTKNGVPMQIEIMYFDKAAAEKLLTPYQENLRKVGISLSLQYRTFETLSKALNDQNFEMIDMAFTGSTFPNPEEMMLSTLADQKSSGNMTGFKDPKVDALLKQYDLAYEQKDRIKILRQIDETYTNAHQMIMQWYAPYQRIAYWDRYGMPEGYLTRTGDYREMLSLWWIDPDKSQRLDQAIKDDKIKLVEGPSEDKFWLSPERALDNKDPAASGKK